MQTVNHNKINTLAFGIMCYNNCTRKDLDFLISRLYKLNLKGTGIDEIQVHLLAITDVAGFLRKPRNLKQFDKYRDKLRIIPVLGNTTNVTEARGYNFLLYNMLKADADYMVLMHESDTIINKDFVAYHMWLRTSAHKPKLIGATTFSTHAANTCTATGMTKMWYGDDVRLRGTMFSREAALNTGVFDEYFLYKAFEIDYFSRMTHHGAFLVRIGKDENTFFTESDTPISLAHKKLKFTKKQNMIWYSRKWQQKGYWLQKGARKELLHFDAQFDLRSFSPTEGSGTELIKMFMPTEASLADRKSRFYELHSDKAIIYGTSLSKAFIKKPYGEYKRTSYMGDDPVTKKTCDTPIKVVDSLKYHDDLLWKAEEIY